MPPPDRAAAARAAFNFWICWGVSEERGGKGVLEPLTPPLPPLVEDNEDVDCCGAVVARALLEVEPEAKEPPCLGILSARSNCELLLIPLCFDGGSEGGGQLVTGLRNGRLTRSFDFVGDNVEPRRDLNSLDLARPIPAE